MCEKVDINESSMNFGPFDKKNIWNIEKTQLYASLGKGVKIAEFVYFDENLTSKLYIVEAKTSSPRKESDENNFQNYINDIRDKFINTLSLYMAVRLKRDFCCDAELPDGLNNVDAGTAVINFVLVIKNSKNEWLPVINDALRDALRTTMKTWALSPTSVKAITEEKAKSIGLVNRNL